MSKVASSRLGGQEASLHIKMIKFLFDLDSHLAYPERPDPDPLDKMRVAKLYSI